MTYQSSIPAWLKESRTKAAEPAWLLDLREKHWQAFLEQGLPHRKNERWKYADLSFLEKQNFNPAPQLAEDLKDFIDQYRLQHKNSHLLVSVNGCYVPQWSDEKTLPAGVVVCALSQALNTHEDLVKTHWSQQFDVEKYPFATLNSALAADGLFVYIPEHCTVSLPIQLLSLTTTEQIVMYPRHLFVLDKYSQALMLEEYYAFNATSYLSNVFTHIILNEHAHLTHYKIQKEGKKAVHIANRFVRQSQQAHATFQQYALGCLFAREDNAIALDGPQANCKTAGFYQLQRQQYIDHHVDIEHRAPGSRSEMLYKGIVNEKARAVFNGRLLVRQGAKQILAHQTNHHLLLSKDAEAYSKPELEIYADDVQCKHGATTGQLDQEALFYLRARGIPHDKAMAMLIAGFAEEIVNQIHHPYIKARIQALTFMPHEKGEET